MSEDSTALRARPSGRGALPIDDPVDVVLIENRVLRNRASEN